MLSSNTPRPPVVPAATAAKVGVVEVVAWAEGEGGRWGEEGGGVMTFSPNTLVGDFSGLGSVEVEGTEIRKRKLWTQDIY